MAAAGLFLFFLCISIAFFLWPRYSRSLPLPRHWVLGLFGTKLGCALAYGYFLSHSPSSSDSWADFTGSIYYGRLIHSIPDFFTYSFPDVNRWADILHYRFWNDLKSNCFQVILMGMNLVTLKNYYTDALLFSTFTFLGWLQFIRLCCILYPANPPVTYLLPFLCPTFLFFYSGLHPDGLLFALLGFISLDAYRIVSGTAAKWTRSRLIVCFCGLLVLKIYLFFLVGIVWAVWGMYYLEGSRLRKAWILMIFLTLVLFVGGATEMAERQHLYWGMVSHGAIGGSPLEPTLSSYLQHFPGALKDAFLPIVTGSFNNLLYWVAGAELMVLWILLALNLIKWRGRQTSLTFYEAGWIYFIAINWLVLGYTIPVLGALIRYRSLLLPFAMALLIFPLLKGRISITKK